MLLTSQTRTLLPGRAGCPAARPAPAGAGNPGEPRLLSGPPRRPAGRCGEKSPREIEGEMERGLAVIIYYVYYICIMYLKLYVYYIYIYVIKMVMI